MDLELRVGLRFFDEQPLCLTQSRPNDLMHIVVFILGKSSPKYCGLLFGHILIGLEKSSKCIKKIKYILSSHPC